MARTAKMAAKSKPRAATQELSDDQLEAVAGGTGAGVPPDLLEEEGEAAAKKKGKASLAQACATGTHFKEVIITVR
jgi:hypothetical protein